VRPEELARRARQPKEPGLHQRPTLEEDDDVPKIPWQRKQAVRRLLLLLCRRLLCRRRLGRRGLLLVRHLHIAVGFVDGDGLRRDDDHLLGPPSLLSRQHALLVTLKRH
jgi:hypothetical protein